jgi:phage/plasmid-associated DNA primase
MRAEWFDFKPTHKLWLSTNHKPEIRGTDAAIWRRIRLVPWVVTIPPAEQDKRLAAKLRDELPGILAWIVQGCLEWRREGLQPPDEVKRATGRYRAEMDVLAAFIDEECVVYERASATAKALYSAYREWCEENGEKPESQRRFGGRLKERGFENGKITAGPHKGNVEWHGIGLSDGSEGPPDGGGGGERSTIHPPRKDLQNSDKELESIGSGGQSRPENGINAKKYEPREVMQKKGPLHPLHPPEGQKTSRQARLTAEEVGRYRELVRQGMSRDRAREALLRSRAEGEGTA